MTWEKEVYSTNVQAIGYDEETQDLYVIWLKGKRSIYSGVPEDVAVQLANAPSVGAMMNSDIKNRYPHRYG